MTACRKAFCVGFFLCFFLTVKAQRSYKPASVLAGGTWFKISVTSNGIYKADVPFLSSLGIGSSIPADQIRVFAGNTGMLPEANSASRIDDLEELAIQVQDGGDGRLDGADYILFYGEGPDKWKKDSATQGFYHQKNLFSDKAFYFITVGGTGKRIT
ncbi:MAG TPA: hypothetical protein VFL47_13435, partial [Flavisolibacter sp.]|nr:hypothetical protein [Flavisolibacter sp.]